MNETEINLELIIKTTLEEFLFEEKTQKLLVSVRQKLLFVLQKFDFFDFFVICDLTNNSLDDAILNVTYGYKFNINSEFVYKQVTLSGE